MPKFRKKPVVIEAEQFNYAIDKQAKYAARTGDNFMDYPVWLDERGPYLVIPTLEGEHRADPTDWIITGIKGERYPCKDDIFKATYEPVNEP